jgi:hypothetical protein
MSKIETPVTRRNLSSMPKKKITSGGFLERCSYLINMREWLHSHETVDCSDKSTYPAKWVWCLIQQAEYQMIRNWSSMKEDTAWKVSNPFERGSFSFTGSSLRLVTFIWISK